MAQLTSPTSRRRLERLLALVECYNLYHVKTLRYNDVKGVLEWLGVSGFTFGRNEDTVLVLKRCLDLHTCSNVGVMAIDEEPRLEGKDRLVVYVQHRHEPACGSHRCDSIILFLVIHCPTRAPYSQARSMLIQDTQTLLKSLRTPLFPKFARCSLQHAKPIPQQERPVIDGYLPTSYGTTVARKHVPLDNFGRKYEPLGCTTEPSPWCVYADIAAPPEFECDFDIEELITTPNKVLGRGAFGVTVPINHSLVAKTSMFPEMVNWSVPFIEDEFTRYAHIASQVEEILIGTSMKHPNILRTLGGFWCDIPDYQLGGRAVLIMERALFSLQEFMARVKDTAVIPMAELDTLRGLDYLRSRTIQHRDFTYRNVLVCHQPERKPIPFAFKISDFGTACNFSTPDQPRGNRTNMAPEVLWCMNAAMGSDIFSWYCVMWELHSGSPLIPYKGPKEGYCKRTYAENLSNLLGVYNPEHEGAFHLRYMKAIDAAVLHRNHKDKRPTTENIMGKLRELGSNIEDDMFLSMGVLCITLFPQERWSPAELLNLNRYKALSEDISEAQMPATTCMPSVQVGQYMPTDVIVGDNLIPEGLAKMVSERHAAGRPVTVLDSSSKVYYGIDFMRLAPDRIEPYEWYSKKVGDLECVYRRKYKKRKGCDTERNVDARHRKTAHVIYRDDKGQADEARATSEVHGADWDCVRPPPQPAPHAMTHSLHHGEEPVPVARNVCHGIESGIAKEQAGDVSTESPLVDCNVARSKPSYAQAGDTLGDRDSHLSTETPSNMEPGSGTVDNSVRGDVKTKDVASNTDVVARAPNQLLPDPISSDVVERPRGTVILRGKEIKGEVDTTMVILKSNDESEITRFKEIVVALSQSMTGTHPLIFAGPRDGLCKCSRGNGVFIFQYAQLFDGCKQVSDWNVSDQPYCARTLLLQVFLTLKTALDAQLLPTHMDEWKYILVSKGAVMIDIVHYLSRNFHEPRSSMFGRSCKSLIGLCAALVAKHMPDSFLSAWLCTPSTKTSAVDVLSQSLERLRGFGVTPRQPPCLLTMEGNHFTFREYTAHRPNWLTHMGDEEGDCDRSHASLLLYGEPRPFRGNQREENPGDTRLSTLIRNIVLRMKHKLCGSRRLEVITLDCTRGLMTVTLNTSALCGVSSIDNLDRSMLLEDICFAHDAVSQRESKWAPVVMFTRCKRQGPLQEFTSDYYRITILLVLLNLAGSVLSLRELFRGVVTLGVTEY